MIRFEAVRFSYRGGEPILDRLDLKIRSGLTLLLGPNGCGKSTLLKLAAGVERPETGRVAIEGRDLWVDEIEARHRLVYVPEHPDVTPYATIADVLDLVCRLRAEPTSTGSAALERAGLAALETRSIRELSLGQRRRALLAAAWIGTPRAALLDEPLESMDHAIRGEIALWIDRLVAAGAAVLAATHEYGPFVEKADRALTIATGGCRLWEPLPSDASERRELLGRLALGRF